MAANTREGMPGERQAMEADARDPMKNEALREQLLRPRTIFTPGHHIRMNFLPIFINVLLPWGLFTFCCALTGFSLLFYRPEVAWVILSIVAICCLAMCGFAARQRTHNPEPTWYIFFAIMLVLAATIGTYCGICIYEEYSRPYYEVLDLRTVGHLDPSKELGQNVMDAGVIHFADGSHIDGHRSWHFKQDTLYCVAPIVVNNSRPETMSYDFWAVGKDCCAVGASDFRCGSWEALAARAAIRALDADSLKYYRLAVQQAETLYDIVASHPVFFYWTKDPMETIFNWSEESFRAFYFASACFFVFGLIATACAVWRFAFMGRARSAYKYAEDVAWNAGHGDYGAFGRR